MKLLLKRILNNVEHVKLLNYENKVAELRRKNVDDLSVKQLLGIIKRRVKH